MLTVLHAPFLSALRLIKDGVAGKASLPVLSHTRLTATTSGSLELRTTNLEAGYTARIAARVEVPIDICLPFALLDSIVGAAYKDNPIAISVNDRTKTATITSGPRTYDVNGIEGDEFPVIPVANGHSISLAPSVLRSLVDTIHAAATDDTRPILASIHLSAKNGTLTAAAADGFRLVRRTIPGVDSDFTTTPPARVLDDVLAKIDPAGEAVTLTINESGNQIIFDQERSDNSDLSIVSRLIDGQFPDIARVIPTSAQVRIILRKAPLLASLKAAKIIASGSNNIIRLTVTATELKLSANTAEVGTVADVLTPNSIVWIADDHPADLTIAVNLAYLVDAINHCNAEQLALAVQGPQNPLVITPVGWAPEQGDQIEIIMPMTQR